MARFHKLHMSTIRMEPEIWEQLLKIAKKVEGNKYEKSTARIVRRCVQHCFEQGIVVELANRKDV